MGNLQIFENPEFGKVRGVELNGVPYLVGRDVATVLGYTNPRDAIIHHVDEEDKGVERIDTLGGPQNITVINESGVYALIFNSRKPNAKKFRHWVTSEVLPAIRKHGMYMTESTIDMVIRDPKNFAALLGKYIEEHDKRLELEKTAEVQAKQIEEMLPKATYYDEVLSSPDAITVRVLASDYGWSAQRMNEFLHNQGVQYKADGTWMLYQKYSKKNYTKTVTYYNTLSKRTVVYTKWTQQGRLFIYELMKATGNLPIMEKENGDVA